VSVIVTDPDEPGDTPVLTW
jgi:hypothetical protein